MGGFAFVWSHVYRGLGLKCSKVTLLLGVNVALAVVRANAKISTPLTSVHNWWFQIVAIKAEFTAASDVRERLFSQAKELNSHAEHACHALQVGDLSSVEHSLSAADAAAERVLAEIEAAQNGWFLRGHGAVSQAFEKFISAKCMVDFFKCGRLARKVRVLLSFFLFPFSFCGLRSLARRCCCTSRLVSC